MLISELINRLQSIKEEHGDLCVFDSDTYEICYVHQEDVEDGDFPDDWNMPNSIVRVEGSR